MQRGQRALLAAAALWTCSAAAQIDPPAAPFGEAPAYATRALSTVPNATAIGTRIWAPALSDGWVPQGVAAGGGYLWVAAYRSTDPKQNRGPCRVFQVVPTDGGVAGQFDLPVQCGHAGGIAHTGDRFLYVADGHSLIRVDTQAALAAGQCLPQGCSTLALRGGLTGDALGYHEGMLWLGRYVKAGGGNARLWQVPEPSVLALIAAGQGALDLSTARRTLTIADQTQGVAVAPDGSLWLTQSGGHFGRLQHVDAATGAVRAAYAMPAGIEDVEFGPDGRLWAVSEAGTRRWDAWPTFYPLVFAVDIKALR